MAKKKFDRDQSLAARPEKMPLIKREEMPDGGLKLTAELIARPFLGFIGGGNPVQRTFELDALGREVYEACDGKSDVRTLIHNFAAKHKISIAEAEISVTTFLKTLLSKNVIAIAIDRNQKVRK